MYNAETGMFKYNIKAWIFLETAQKYSENTTRQVTPILGLNSNKIGNARTT
jgi:hypothetical protein